MSVELTAALRAAAAHLDHHPELLNDTAAVRVSNGTLYTQVYRHAAHLAALAEWVPTLTETRPVRVHIHADGETFDLALHGHLVDGTQVEVVCLPDQEELDLLAAQTRIGEGDTFPVELLLRLTDKRTCVSPGDQEHDHAMCEDVVADEAAECPMDDPDCEAGAQLDPETACHTACEAPAAEAVRR